MLDPESGNVRSTNYSDRRYPSQDEASTAGKAAVLAFLASDTSERAPAPSGGKRKD
ncbi:hypothetical protein ABE599_20655 [Achromobacter mucicolens]|uniref:hypothetical protein n=1 Tax=Achromobacter mucicolens TaxID=1389922 RepID=UPI00320B538F